jgi:hypothetical protein
VYVLHQKLGSSTRKLTFRLQGKYDSVKIVAAVFAAVVAALSANDEGSLYSRMSSSNSFVANFREQ